MAIVDVNALSTEFPDNRIVLINGTELICYPKVVQPKSFSEDKLTLDLTGKYLTIGSKPSKLVAKKETTENDELKDFFLKNAFLFYRNAHRILNDSRMFLAPVPVQNGLMYTGTSGFRNPTLGVYVEWWLNCEVNLTKDKEGKDAMTYHIIGSPFSGSNRCTCVYPDGRTESITHSPFIKVWSMFMNINQRYTKAKRMYEAYSLLEVVVLLQAACESRESELETQLYIAEGNTQKLKRKYSCLKDEFIKLRDNYTELTLLHYKDELEDFRIEYRSRMEKAEQEKESLARARAKFKSQMKQGLINNVEYQHAITPLTRRKKAIEHELIMFRAEKTVALVKKGHITYSQIDNYINQEDEQ